MGASATGKTSLVEEVGVPTLVSHTTREQREGEIDGEDYYFINKETYDKLDKVEWTKYAGNYYCLARGEIEKKLRESDKIAVILDRHGIERLFLNTTYNITPIYIYSPIEDIYERLRNTRDTHEVNDRLYNLQKQDELTIPDFVDYIIMNKNGYFGRALSQLEYIMGV